MPPQRPKPAKPKQRTQGGKQEGAKQGGGGGWSSSEEDEANEDGDVDGDAEPRDGDGWLPLDPWGCPDYLGSPKRRAVVPAGGGAVQGVGGKEGEEDEEEEELDGVVEVVEVEGGVAGVAGDGSVQRRRRPGRKRQRNRL